MRSPSEPGSRSRALALGAGLAAIGWAGEARAGVTGKQGIEIEGAQDRRGFYFGFGPGFGFTYFDRTWVPNIRIDAVFGGGITKRLTLGVALHATPYLRADTGAAFGGDLEITGFVFKGLFLRGGLGGQGVPRTRDGGLTGGVGGLAGIGYEFFLNQTVAMGLGVYYDLRWVPAQGARHGGYVGVRFTWY